MYETAFLVETPEAPIPSGADPGWFVGAGGGKLRAALFTPSGRTRGSVVLSGGRTEPIEKYFETIKDFMDRGFVVLAHDWRGQGLSLRELPDRLKGHAKGYKSFLEDYRRLLNAYEPRLPKPWVAVGHSMGGCLTLLALANGERRFSSAVLCAPMLGLKFGKISPTVAGTMLRLNLALGRSGRYVMGQPGLPFDDTFEGNALTHDPVRFARYRGQVRANPDIALGSPTWGWLDFALKATSFLANPERLRGVTIPVEIVSAAEDQLVDNAGQAAAVRNLPQGRLITVPGAYHEILMETDDMRNFFMRVFDALTGKTAPMPAAPPAEAPPAPATPPQAIAVAAPPPAPEVPAAKKPAAKKPAAKKTAVPVATKAKPAAKASPVPKAAPAPAKATAKSVTKVAVTKATVAKTPSPKKTVPSVVAKPAIKAVTKKVVAKPAAKPKPTAKPATATKPTVAKASAAKKSVTKTPAAKT